MKGHSATRVTNIPQRPPKAYIQWTFNGLKAVSHLSGVKDILHAAVAREGDIGKGQAGHLS